MNTSRVAVSIFLAVGLLAGTAGAVNIETVPVGNPGNAGELSGDGAGGNGADRICGAVGYTYNIGKYEVTAGQYTEFLNAVAGVDTYGLYKTNMWSNVCGCKIERFTGSGTVGDPYQYRVASDRANRPVNYVTYWDSCRFANWLHNNQPTGAQHAGTTETGAYTLNGYNGNDGRTIQRNANWKWAVTSEDEWYKAAYYDPATSSYYDYPTSSSTAPGRDLDDASGNNANYYGNGNPYPIQSPYYTTAVGEFENSDSPYGTFDQGGDVSEWNESVVYEGVGYSYRGLRGGSFGTSAPGLLASSRNGYYATFGSDNKGFRVSEVPEPASLLLLALGGMAVMRRRG